jgi:hypothetical protein
VEEQQKKTKGPTTMTVAALMMLVRMIVRTRLGRFKPTMTFNDAGRQR